MTLTWVENNTILWTIAIFACRLFEENVHPVSTEGRKNNEVCRYATLTLPSLKQIVHNTCCVLGCLALKRSRRPSVHRTTRTVRWISQLNFLLPFILTRVNAEEKQPEVDALPIRNKPLRMLEAKEAAEAFAPTSQVSTQKARSSISMTILDLRTADLTSQIATLPLTVSDLPDLPGVWPSVWGSLGDWRARALESMTPV